MTFYKISEDNTKRKRFAFGILIGTYPQDIINCTKCGRTWKKEKLSNESNELEIVLSNNNYPDFTGVVFHDLISDKTKDVLLYENITGVNISDKIKILSRNDLSLYVIKRFREEGYKVNEIPNEPIRYHRMFLEFGANCHSKSEIVLNAECSACGYGNYVTVGKPYIDPTHPIYIDENSWDGKDIFAIKSLGFNKFCTQRFVDIYNKYNLTGWVFEKVENI